MKFQAHYAREWLWSPGGQVTATLWVPRDNLLDQGQERVAALWMAGGTCLSLEVSVRSPLPLLLSGVRLDGGSAHTKAPVSEICMGTQPQLGDFELGGVGGGVQLPEGGLGVYWLITPSPQHPHPHECAVAQFTENTLSGLRQGLVSHVPRRDLRRAVNYFRASDKEQAHCP